MTRPGLTRKTLIVMVATTGFTLLAGSAVQAGAPYDMCDPNGWSGGWIGYSYGQCGSDQFHLSWGNGGTDRASWNPDIPRDMYITCRHRFELRSNGDTAADHWNVYEGNWAGVTINQSGSGVTEADVGRAPWYNNDDWMEVGSDNGGTMDTIADVGRFYPELDAIYSSRQAETAMYCGNVYYWRFTMNNPAQAYWTWTPDSNDRLAHTGGSVTGPGWAASQRVAEVSCAPGSNANIWFNMRPTATGSSNEDFQMVRESVSWFGDAVDTNGNMRVGVSVTRKAPAATDGDDTGAKKKGETVRFFIHGSDSFADTYSYAWDFDGAYTQGWSAASQCALTQEDTNNRLKVAVTGGDPYMYSSPGLAITTTECKWLQVRMWASGGSTAKLYWLTTNTSFDESHKIEWSISGDSAWHIYHVYLPSGTGWSGTVNRLRMDPVNTGAASGQTVYIDYLRFYDESALTAKIWLGTVNNTWDIYNTTAMTWDATNHYFYKDYTITGNYPTTYYCAMHVYNSAGTECENDTGRIYSDDNREYAMANTAPTCSNANYNTDAWTADKTPTLQWNYADTDFNSQSHYRVQVDNNSDFSSPAIDTGNIASSANTYTASALGDGRWYWRVQVKDNYVFSTWSPGTSFRVDATAPTNPTVFSETQGAVSDTWQSSVNNPTFTWNNADDGTGSGVKDYAVYFGTDPNGTSTTYQTGTSYSPGEVTSGIYYLRIRARDNVNNESEWITGFTFKYDAAAPSSSCQTPTTLTKAPLTDITWSASDDHSGVGAIQLWYKLGTEGTWTSSGISGSGTGGTFDSWTPPDGDGTYYIRSVASDLATPVNGETDLPADGDDSFVYDTAGPTVTVEQAAGQEDPTGLLPIHFDVVFSETVNDFESTDVTMSGTATGITFNVTGSGTNYQIEITGIEVPGTVVPSLDAGVAHDAAGNSSTASTSTDNSVLYAIAPPPHITNWASVRTHGGGVGDMAITLNPDGTSTPIVEPRRYGIRKIMITFDSAVQAADGNLDTGDIAVTDTDANSYTPTAISLTNGGLTLNVEFDPGMPDQKRYTFDLAGKLKAAAPPWLPLEGDADCQVRNLVGDINKTGNVNLIDVGAVKSKAYTAVDITTCIYDINTDGAINLIDVALTKSMYGHTAP